MSERGLPGSLRRAASDGDEWVASSVVFDGATRGPEDCHLPKHVYVHVPLCRSKCAYCDFFSVTGYEAAQASSLVDHTIDAARTIVSQAAAGGIAVAPLASLYVGGGTPSVLGPELTRLVRSLREVFGLRPRAEVTVEGNPDSVTPGLLADLREAGVTRISLGVQSLDDDALAWLGRRHSADDALRAVRAVRDGGLGLSVDLIAGVPCVTGAGWTATLQRIIEEGVTHVSVYPLAVQEGTVLALEASRGEREAPDEDASATAMVEAADRLARAGLCRYEVANYAVPGHESVHNRAYWTGARYLALGGGAHGMLDARTAGVLGILESAVHASALPGAVARVRYAYGERVLFDLTPALVEYLMPMEAAREDAMLGMRMTEGIDDALVERAQLLGALRGLARDGLVRHEAGRWRPTERGWLLGNEVFRRIWME